MATRTVEMVGEHKLEQVFLTVEDHIGILTLHNPPVNAASGTVQEEIIMLCDYINHDDDIWVCIMHSDLKTFCVGVDIKRFKKSIDDKDVTNTQEVYYDGALAFITAEELTKYGGVTKVVDTLDELMPAAMDKAREICKRGPLVLRYLKACMNAQEDFQMKRKNDLEVTYTRYMARHKDFNEGVTAFLEKREPQYTGE